MTTPHQRYETLLVMAIDGCLSPDEQTELDAHVAECDDCAAELADFRLIKETTDAMTTRILKDAEIEPPRPRGAARAWLVVSMLVMLAGALLWFGNVGYEIARAEDIPTFMKLGIGLVVLGGLGLFGYALKTRVRASGRDPYEEIDQ